MATMIPPIIAPGTRSEGEREVFRRLRDDPTTSDWIVLHSLGLAVHDERVAGEIDFVVIIPSTGVLCLEVKGCSATNLHRDERGLWYYGPNDKGDARGPFSQAADGMHSLHRQVVRDYPELAGVQFSSGVIFPFAPFKQRSVEWHDWEVIDSHLFRSAPMGRSLRHMMESWRVHLLGVPKPPRLDHSGPSIDQCEAIRAVLRGRFELPVDPKARAEQLARDLRHYTAEQYVALDAMETNPRTIFSGPAGVGKTLLAIEAARRASAEGRRVLLVCFNALLGTWLEKEAEALPNVEAGTLHRHMLAVSELGRAPDSATDDFWRTILPERACERLFETDDKFVFDELVLDEAQDLLRDSYLDFLDLSVRGGLAAGRWRLFGDFENQSIYEASSIPLGEFRVRRAEGAPVYGLRVNCRNTPLVAEWVRLLAGLSPGYGRVLRPDDGIVPTILFYDDEEQQREQLVGALDELDKLGFRSRDVVILSPRADQSSAAGSLRASPWHDRLRPFARAQGGHVGHGTIQSYKGLEAAAVVVTDIETIGTARDRALLYVATTRPLQRLVILARACVRREAIAMLGSTDREGKST